MKPQILPIYNLSQFNQVDEGNDFYINNFVTHLKQFHFVNTPHKHDFYLVVFFTHGSGVHEIDFVKYAINPGSIFFLSPGQSHSWKLSHDINGYVFFHSQSFYDLNFTSKKVKQFPFYTSLYNKPFLNLKSKSINKLSNIFDEMLLEYKQDKLMKYDKICSLLDILYIGLSRLYIPKKETLTPQNYLIKLHKFEELVEQNFTKIKSPKLYAEKMNMSEKHLNRICKICLNKTTTDIIADRLIIEAKRILIHNNCSVSEAAEMLGFNDITYFSKFFKKKSGQAPLAFVNKLK